MQLIGSLAALGLIATLAGLTLVTWQRPTSSAVLHLYEAQVQQTIRQGQLTALQSGLSTRLVWPIEDAQTHWSARALTGNAFVAFPDGSVSPGELLLCRQQQGRRLTISQLGRVRAEPALCPPDVN
ncbi:MAG: hypothetical protein ACO31Z_05165 [Litorivicinaceae bacterium]